MKLREYFVCAKKTKIMTWFHLSFAFMTKPQRMRVHSSAHRQAAVHLGSNSTVHMHRGILDNGGGWMEEMNC